MKKLFFVTLITCSTLIISCNSKLEKKPTFQETLPSWKDTDSKLNIIKFVEQTTNPNDSSFIPKKDRIATFDNDGTLWAEQPFYFQLYFSLNRIKELAPEHPEWKETQPYKAVLEDDFETLSEMELNNLLGLVLTSHTGNTTQEFEQSVVAWSQKAKHPTKDVPFQALVYQPMLELIDYLKANDFKVYIVSGGGVDFMRAFLTDIYGIPKEQIIGSRIKTQFIENEDQFKIIRLPEIEYIDDKEGKPLNIEKIIGKKPVVAVGNSDGDLDMLQWSTMSKHKTLQIYIHHTDSIREWAYDRDSKIGKLDKGLDVANAKQWTIVDMKNEWLTVFPEGKN